MSSAIIMDASTFNFLPVSGSKEPIPQTVQRDSKELEREIEQRLRAQLDAEYQQQLELEVSTRVSTEHMRFEKMLKQCTTEIDQIITQLKGEIQNNVVDLSIRLAEVILRHELPDGEMIRDLIVKTLEPVSDLQGALVRISSADWELFGESVIKSGERGVGNTVEFAEDPNLAQGDVIVESRNGIFDARLGERLKLLKETLLERTGGADAHFEEHPALAQMEEAEPEQPSETSAPESELTESQV